MLLLAGQLKLARTPDVAFPCHTVVTTCVQQKILFYLHLRPDGLI